MQTEMSSPAQQDEVPAGYMKNALGHLVPTELVRESDLLRDELARDLAVEAMELSEKLQAFKRKALGDIEALIALSAEKYGIKIGGKGGNAQLYSYDGKYRIERVNAKVIVFTEELEAAKALVEKCIIKWSDGARSELKAIVMQAFKPNTKGELRTSAVIELLRLEIDDEDWKQAMQALKDCLQANGTTTYVRVYKRIGTSEKYQLISLDLAGVAA